MLPGEAHELLLGHSQNVKNIVPFDPHKAAEPPSFINMLRHNSLSALDVRRYKSRSLPGTPNLTTNIPSPLSQPQKDSSPSPNIYPTCASPPIVRFSLGGEVTCISFSPPQVTNLIASEGMPSRNRYKKLHGIKIYKFFIPMAWWKISNIIMLVITQTLFGMLEKNLKSYLC